MHLFTVRHNTYIETFLSEGFLDVCCSLSVQHWGLSVVLTESTVVDCILKACVCVESFASDTGFVRQCLGASVEERHEFSEDYLWDSTWLTDKLVTKHGFQPARVLHVIASSSKLVLEWQLGTALCHESRGAMIRMLLSGSASFRLAVIRQFWLLKLDPKTPKKRLTSSPAVQTSSGFAGIKATTGLEKEIEMKPMQAKKKE